LSGLRFANGSALLQSIYPDRKSATETPVFSRRIERRFRPAIAFGGVAKYNHRGKQAQALFEGIRKGGMSGAFPLLPARKSLK
jgi:hypothetical protein